MANQNLNQSINQPNIQPPQQPPVSNIPSDSGSANNNTAIAALLLFFIYPIGLFFMWFKTKWPKWIKVVLTLPVILAILGIALVFFVAFTSKGLPQTPGSTQNTTKTSNVTAGPTSAWKTTSSSICNFSLQYPQTWQTEPTEESSCVLSIIDPARGKNQLFILTALSSETTWQSILDKNEDGQMTTFAQVEALRKKPITDNTATINSIYFHKGTTVYNIIYSEFPTDPELAKTYQQILKTFKFVN